MTKQQQSSRLSFTAWELLVIETLLTRNRETYERASMEALIKKIERAKPKG